MTRQVSNTDKVAYQDKDKARTVRTKLLFWQQTGSALHALPEPTPTTERGEHLSPIFAVTSWRLSPRMARIVEPAMEFV